MAINTTNITLTNLPLIAMFEWQIFSHVSTPPLSQCLSICLSPTNKRSNLRGSWRGSALGLGQHGNHIFNLSIYLTSILYSVKTKTICSDNDDSRGEGACCCCCCLLGCKSNQVHNMILPIFPWNLLWRVSFSTRGNGQWVPTRAVICWKHLVAVI